MHYPDEEYELPMEYARVPEETQLTTPVSYFDGRWQKPAAVLLSLAAAGGAFLLHTSLNRAGSRAGVEAAALRDPFQAKGPACVETDFEQETGPVGCVDVHQSTEESTFATTYRGVLGEIADYRIYLNDMELYYSGTDDYPISMSLSTSGNYAISITHQESTALGQADQSLRLDVNSQGQTSATYHRVVWPKQPGVAFKQTDIALTPDRLQFDRVTDLDGDLNTRGDRYEQHWTATRKMVGSAAIGVVSTAADIEQYAMTGSPQVGRQALITLNTFLQEGRDHTSYLPVSTEV